MALSIPHQSTWDRTLPNPAELLPTGMDPRRSSSLLQHHISSLSSDHFVNQATTDTVRRSTVADIARPERSSHCEDIFSRQRRDSIMSIDSPTESFSDVTSPPERSSGFCLCVPDPKIPRPRNAFILYRQNQHADVVKAHPGLPNPDISKIIGEQWRHLSLEEKDKWKAFAEQEKARHSQQFPDYRYRPKRSAKYQSVDGASQTTLQSLNCAKCGGKTMNPPHTPHYPAFDQPSPGISMSRPPKRSYAEAQIQPRVPSMIQIAPPPYSNLPMRYAFQPRHDSTQYIAPLPPQNRHRGPMQPILIDGPDAKKRRMNPPFATRPPHQYYERERANSTHPETMMRHQMPPPPPQRAAQSAASQSTPPRPVVISAPRRELSLTLPPLKTGTSPRPAASQGSQTQNIDVEGIITSYPVLTKLKTLHSITPIINTHTSSSPSPEVRGAIIAVEGLDQRRVIDMTQSLAEQLEKEGKFLVRIFLGPDPYSSLQSSRRASLHEGGEHMTTEKYLGLISEWHKTSRDMVDFVTHEPGKVMDTKDQDMTDASAVSPQPQSPFERSPIRRSPISAVSPCTVLRGTDMHVDTPIVPFNTEVSPRVTRSRIPQAAPNQQEAGQNETALSSLDSTNSSSPLPQANEVHAAGITTSHLIPIAIVPHYQLTTVDACSIALPIFDNYDPLTHWRWHATLWRGCVGPDVSVVIKSAHESHEDDSLPPIDTKKLDAQAQAPVHKRNSIIIPPSRVADQAPSSGAPPVAAAGSSGSVPMPFGVEVRLSDHRAVIVRAAGSGRGSDATNSSHEKDVDKDNENWEKAKRRVGFEVEEWMRR